MEECENDFKKFCDIWQLYYDMIYLFNVEFLKFSSQMISFCIKFLIVLMGVFVGNGNVIVMFSSLVF